MTILVTGGAGYIGSHMVYELLDRGETVVVLDRLSTGFDWAVAPGAELVVGDIGDQPMVERLIADRNVDSIIHFAGSVVVPDSVADPLEYYLNNTVRSRSLIAAAVAGGVDNFIFSSTAAVYGSPEAVPVTEAAPKTPDRRMAPQADDGAHVGGCRRGPRDALRHPALFQRGGADPDGRTGQSTRGATHLIKVACETALGKRDGMKVYGTDYPTQDGTCVRDYIHVTDLVGAHAGALDYLRSGGASTVANCGYGRGYSVLEVLDTVRDVVGHDFPVETAGRRPGDASAIVADGSRARALFDWTPRHDDLPGIVRSALSWEEKLARRNTP